MYQGKAGCKSLMLSLVTKTLCSTASLLSVVELIQQTSHCIQICNISQFTTYNRAVNLFQFFNIKSER